MCWKVNHAVLTPTQNPVQALHLGDSALHHPENGQARPEDPAGVGGSQRQAGEATAQEGNVGRRLRRTDGPEAILTAASCAHVFQRDSGDDEDMDKASEDEEGQLEEQIERLQEKVESAQSEQKNLFLVIFQVKVCLFFKNASTLAPATCWVVMAALHHAADGTSGPL